MIQSPIDIVGQYVQDYNDARAANDVDKAIHFGRLAVRDATDELKKPNLNATHRDYYKRVISNINEFLANPVASVPAKASAQAQSEDKIKTTDWFAAPVPNLTLNDIAGLQDVKNEFVVNIFAPLYPKYSDIYKKYRGSELGLQVLLFGPPGTGKTHTVKCLAGELGCKIAVVQIKDVMANLVGDGAKIIAEIFEQANQYDRSIIFFDEIDAIASSREGDDSRHTKEQLTTLLTYMDGFTSKTKPGQIRIVIAATNRPWALDSAVKRGGRFDTQIYIPLPDTDARRQLVRIALGKDEKIKNRVDVPCDSDVTVDWLTERFVGYSGADIKAVCRQAVGRPLRREILALSRGKPQSDCVRREDFEWAFSRYINSITDEALMQFDAYKMNMEYDGEYFRIKSEQILIALYNIHVKKNQAAEMPEWYELSWFFGLYRSGYVSEMFGRRYALDFLVDIEKEYEKSRIK